MQSGTLALWHTALALRSNQSPAAKGGFHGIAATWVDYDCLVFTIAVKVTIQYKAMMMRTISLLHSGPGLSGGHE